MRTAWVLTEEERKMKFEERVKKNSASHERNYDVVSYINEAELRELSFYVMISEYQEMSKVEDMEPFFTREVIRSEEYNENSENITFAGWLPSNRISAYQVKGR